MILKLLLWKLISKKYLSEALQIISPSSNDIEQTGKKTLENYLFMLLLL